MAYIGQSLTEGTRRAYTFVATSGQTTFNAVYGVGAVDVYQNGILLQPSDYNSSSGSSVVLGVGAAVNDEITIIAHNTFSVADTLTASQGGTFTGNVQFDGSFTSKGIDDNADATAITIDSSENVMIGTTTQDAPVDNGGSGVTLRPQGVMLIGGTGTSIYANREDSDGEVMQFRKDGSTVGSIGSVASGANLYISANSGVGLGIGGDNLYPVNASGASTDNSLDLGDASARFNDLYLGGGAYIGGTGAANHLDDYETGTFQMTMTGKTGGAVGHGQYVKIGNICHFSWYSATQSITSSVAGVLGGLPFTHISPNNSAYAAVTLAHNTWVSNASTGYINIGTNSIYPTANNSSTASNTSTGSKYVMCSGSYTVG